jgi:hypothetical protein
MDAEQPPGADAVGDRFVVDTDGVELDPGDVAVLPASREGDGAINLRTYPTHT